MASDEKPAWQRDPEAAFEEAEKRVSSLGSTILSSFSLDLSDLHALQRLPPLRKVEGLIKMDLNNTKISDLSELRAVPSLKELSARSTNIIDLDFLDGLPSLEDLDVAHTAIREISQVQQCPNMKDLGLWATFIEDISPVRTLQGLAYLSIWDTPITDISSLAGLPKLTWLDMEGCRVTDAQPLLMLPALKTLYVSKTIFPDYSWIENLAQLEGLGINNTSFSETGILSNAQSLEWLYARGTQIENLNGLRALGKLSRIDLADSKVSDIAPLRYIPELSYLNVDRTRVSSLFPLAQSLTLLRDIVKRPGSSGLSFLNCPVGDITLRSFAKLKNPERTIGTLNYLREKVGLPPVDGTELRDKARVVEASTEQLFARLQQDNLGARSVRIGDFFTFAQSSVETDRDVAQDPVAQQLHRETARKVTALSDLAARIRNQPGWRDFAATVAPFRRLIEKPLSEIAEQPTELWSLCVSLGAYSEQNEATLNQTNSFAMPLEPDGKRVLNDVVSTAAVLARRFHSVRVLDEELRQFEASTVAVSAASEVVLSAAQQSVLVADNANIVIAELSSPLGDGPQSNKAHGRGMLSARNLALAAMGMILTGYRGEFGADVAQQDVLFQRAKNWLLAKESDLVEIFATAPEDIQTAVRETFRRTSPTENEAVLEDKAKE